MTLALMDALRFEHLRSHLPARLLLMALWVLLLVAATLVAPPAQDTQTLVWKLATFQGPDPWLDATFNLMGLWPLLYARVLWRGIGKFWWPIVAVMAGMAIGAFILLPTTALRSFGAQPHQDPAWVRWFTGSVWVGGVLSLFGFVLLAYGTVFGDPTVLIRWWRSDGFVFTYLCDFSALALGFGVLLWAERAAAESQ
ncbi:MAG: hypothetical protein ACFB9M_07235 [Myxococcota bacterium]